MAFLQSKTAISFNILLVHQILCIMLKGMTSYIGRDPQALFSSHSNNISDCPENMSRAHATKTFFVVETSMTIFFFDEYKNLHKRDFALSHKTYSITLDLQKQMI